MKKGVIYSTIDDYIASRPVNVRSGLMQMRQTIQKAAPAAVELISYQMPAFKFHGMLVWFAAMKEHYGFYPGAGVIGKFKDRLGQYELSKGTIRFPLEKKLPLGLITAIVKYKVKENFEKEEVKKPAKGRRIKK